MYDDMASMYVGVLRSEEAYVYCILVYRVIHKKRHISNKFGESIKVVGTKHFRSTLLILYFIFKHSRC